MKLKHPVYFLVIIVILAIVFSYTIRIDTGLYCAESPVVRWKFAIYTGECNDETGCHFQKMEGTGISEYFGFTKITCYGEEISEITEENATDNNENLQAQLSETSKALPNGFVREYSSDSSIIWDKRFENINGCKKAVECKTYGKNWDVTEEWTKSYKTDSTQTCDFSAYILYKKEYDNGRIKKECSYFAGSEESEEQPCGNWKYYDSEGKVKKIVKYGKCDLSQFGRN